MTSSSSRGAGTGAGRSSRHAGSISSNGPVSSPSLGLGVSPSSAAHRSSRSPAAPADALGERLRTARRQRVEHLLDGRPLVWRNQAADTGTELGDGLRAAQRQRRQHEQLTGREVPPLVSGMAISSRAPAVRRMDEADEADRLEREQRGLDRAIVVGDDRTSVGRLIAGEAQRVERQRIALRNRCFLLDQRSEDTDLGARSAPSPKSRSRFSTGEGCSEGGELLDRVDAGRRLAVALVSPTPVRSTSGRRVRTAATPGGRTARRRARR